LVAREAAGDIVGRGKVTPRHGRLLPLRQHSGYAPSAIPGRKSARGWLITASGIWTGPHHGRFAALRPEWRHWRLSREGRGNFEGRRRRTSAVVLDRVTGATIQTDTCTSDNLLPTQQVRGPAVLGSLCHCAGPRLEVTRTGMTCHLIPIGKRSSPTDASA
jgi:hypothetical protein